jgi:hypothetical protein
MVIFGLSAWGSQSLSPLMSVLVFNILPFHQQITALWLLSVKLLPKNAFRYELSQRSIFCNNIARAGTSPYLNVVARAARVSIKQVFRQ